MTVTKKHFGILPDGSAVHLYTLKSETAEVGILDYGATLRSIVVPDRDGSPVDVILGYDTIEDYVSADGYLGATVGRYANRIKEGKFELNGKIYTLAVNNTVNHLHGGLIGFDKKMWDVKETAEGLCFSLVSPDGEEGYPGTLSVSVTFSLSGAALSIAYRAETDADTILNLTNHAYFNLAGSGSVKDQILMIAADAFNVTDENCLPTGEIMAVAGTAMDFRSPRAIGDAVDSDEPCVKLSDGYDANFILNGTEPAAEAWCKKTGIRMTLTTDQPGIQFYSMNRYKTRRGKGGALYEKRDAFCLETQHFPDSIHHPDWPSVVLHPGEVFESKTTYSFDIG